MSRPHLLPREQQLALTALLVISAWVFAWFGLPLWDRLSQLEQRATVSQKKLARLNELITRKPLIEQAYQAYAGVFSDESDELIQGVFLDELEQLARAGNLQINLKPRPIQREGKVSHLAVELEVDATQEALLAFLDRLLTRSSLIELDRLRIAATASTESPLRATLLINKVVVRR